MIAPINEPEGGDAHNFAHLKKGAMLAAYAECGIVSTACKAAEIARRTHYDWYENDPEYKSAFNEAHEVAVEAMEKEARRRAIQGCRKPVFHKGARCGYVREFSDTLLIFMLKGAKPNKYRERIEQTVTGKIEHNHTVEQLRVVVEETRRDESYVRIERERAIAHGPLAGTNGHNGKPGSLGNGKAPGPA